MRTLWRALRHLASIAFRRRLSLQMEVVALRHQLCVYGRIRPSRFRLEPGDRLLWSCLSRLWPEWREGLYFVRPRAVLAWQKRRFRYHWRRKSRGGQPGRPAIDPEIRKLIQQISRANPRWGSPHLRRVLRSYVMHQGVSLSKSRGLATGVLLHKAASA